jgi:hypothetical protein
MSRGVLSVLDDRAEFQPKSGAAVVVISHVRSVRKGWKNQVHGERLIRAVDTWIEVIYGDPPSAVFVNDGRWFGLATYLPHGRMVAALEGLIRTS